MGRRIVLYRGGLAAWDAIAWILATVALVAARYDFSIAVRPFFLRLIIQYAVAAIALQVVGGFLTKLYRGRHPLGSFDEVATLGLLVGGIGIGLAIYFALTAGTYPRGVTLTVPLGAFLLMGAGRFVVRSLRRAQRERSSAADAVPVLVYGAGNAGQQLARLVANDPDAPYQIAGFLDDDPAKEHLQIGSIRVLGGIDDLVSVADKRGIGTVILAIPTASRQLMRRLSSLCDEAGLRLLVMPPVRDIVGGQITLASIHQIDVTDLLGRTPIKTDLGAIAGYLQGKVVLVSGAGGSIGSEIARQVRRFGPKELVLLDRDESGLHAAQLSIYKQGLLDTPDMVLCDIRDEAALDAVFAAHRPEVVFHAAALKHLPMLEQYPLEAWKTNVLGTLNMLEVARRHGVRRFVNISTDKAADATSVLGRSKRLAEQLTAWFAHSLGMSFLSVRFGNVLGSRGSMLYTFTSQIEAGGPVTVTHPDVTRYFMTIPEACELVIQAGAIGQPGDVLVLDMGEPVRILEVAQGLIARSGKPIDIVFTGLRPGEKLHEVLFSGAEEYESTTHPLIRRVGVPPLEPGTLLAAVTADADAVRAMTSSDALRPDPVIGRSEPRPVPDATPTD